jgi:protein-tyrosine-phosphatase
MTLPTYLTMKMKTEKPAFITLFLSITPVRVLFLCTHNSARSQMAEALICKSGSGGVEVFSVGSKPTSIHPLATKVMAHFGIDLSSHRSKHLNEYIGNTLTIS